MIWGFSLFGERRKITELKSGGLPVTNRPILWLYCGSPEGCPVEKNWYVLDSRIHMWCYCTSLHFCSAQSLSSSLIWVWVEGCGLLLPSLTRMYSLNWDESAPPPHEHVIRKPLLCKCSRTCSCKHKAKINHTDLLGLMSSILLAHNVELVKPLIGRHRHWHLHLRSYLWLSQKSHTFSQNLLLGYLDSW